MPNQQLLEYITYQLDHGMSPEALERSLKAEGGWSHDDVKAAFLALNLQPILDPVKAPAPARSIAPMSVEAPAAAVRPTTPVSIPAPMPAPKIVVPETVIVPPPSPQPQPQTPPASSWELPPREKPSAPSFSQPSFSTSPLPPTSASRVFVAPQPQQYQPVRHSGMRTIVILLVIILLGGAGAYVYFYQPDMVQSIIGKFTQSTKNTDSTAGSPVPSPKVASPLKKDAVNNSLYAFTVPTGWKSVLVANDGRGVQASNSTEGYVVSVAVTPIPQSGEKITSADQIITSETVETIIKSEFAGAVLGKVSSGTLGGEKAVVIAFTIPATGTGSEGNASAKEAILQYSAVHGDSLYSVVFKSSLDKGLSLLKEAEGIVSSFAFK